MSPKSGNYKYYVILYAKTEPNETTGNHRVSVREVLACTASSSFYKHTTTYSGTINGISVFDGKNKPSAAWELGEFSAGGISFKKGTVIAEGYTDIDCTDGLVHSVPISCLWKFTENSSANNVPAQNTSRTVSATASLDAIIRKSTVTLPTISYIGSTCVIAINSYNTSYSHSLYYKTNYQSGWTIIERKVSSATYNWTVPEALFELIPQDNSLSVTIRCDTYSGNTLLGSNNKVMRVYVDSSTSSPTITCSVQDINASTLLLTGNAKTIVSGESKCEISTDVEAKNAATVRGLTVRYGTTTHNIAGSTASLQYTINDAVIYSLPITAETADSRNFSSKATAPGLTLISYRAPTIAAQNQPDWSDITEGTVSVSATGVWYNGSFGTVQNELTIRARYKVKGAETFSEYVSLNVTLNDSSYFASGVLTGLDYTKAYDIEMQACDAIYGVSKDAKSVIATLSRAMPVFDWGDEDFRFNVPVNFADGVVTSKTDLDLQTNLVSSYSGDNWVVKSSSGFVHIQLRFSPLSAIAYEYSPVVGNLPEDIRPAFSTFGMCISTNGGIGYVYVNESGKIMCKTADTSQTIIQIIYHT